MGPQASTAPSDPTVAITYDSQLIEGFLQTTNIQVDPPGLSPSPISVFMNSQGLSEALTIQGGYLYHVCREPLSDSGWNVYALGAGFARLTAQNSATVWGMNESPGGPQVWQGYLGRWTLTTTQVNGQSLTDVSVCSDGTLRCIAGGQPYAWDAATNQWTPTLAFSGNLTRAPLGVGGNLVALAGTTVWFTGGGRWFPFIVETIENFAVTDLSVGTDGSNWLVANGRLYTCPVLADLNPAEVAPPPGDTVCSVFATSATQVWCTTLSGSNVYNLYQGTRASADQPFTWNLYATPGDSAALQLSIGIDGTMWLLDSSGQAWNQAGGTWQRQMVPTNMVSGWQIGGGINEVATATDSDGDLFAYFVQNGQCFWVAFEDGLWSPQPNPFTTSNGQTIASGLRITNDRVTNDVVIYGVGTDGSMIMGGDGNSLVAPVSFKANFDLTNASLQVLAAGDDPWTTFAVIGGLIYVAYGTAQDPINTGFVQMYDPNGVPTNVQSLVNLPTSQMTALGASVASVVYAIDGNGIIWCVGEQEGQASFTQISGPNANMALQNPVIAAAGYMTGLPTPQICLLAADDTNLLWILRITVAQTGNTSAAAWHPLLPDCSFVALGPTGTAGNEIFTLDQNNNLNRLWSDPLSLAWRDFPVHQPTFPGVTTEPYYIAQYVTEFTVSDTSQLASGVPLGNYAVTLTAAENVGVSITGVTYELGPQLPPISLTTDYRGKVTVSTPALGLHTPQLSFTAGPQNCIVYPPQNIQSQLGTVQGSDLAAAQSKTSWNATEPLVTDDQNVNNAATALGNTIQVKTNKQINGGTVLPPSLDASLPLQQALRQARAAHLLGPNGKPAELGGFWDDLLHDIEDLFQAIRKAIVVVTDVVVDIEQGIIQFTASLAGVVSQAIQFVINTIHDVVAALEAAFNWIVSEISKVIDWLKEIFDWTNILHVKNVLEAYFNQFMNNTIASLSGDNLTALTSYVSAAFGALANDIAGFFDKIGSLPNAGDSVSNQPVMQTSTTVGSTALQQDKSSQGYASNQVKSNYVHTQTNTYIAQGGTIGTAGAGSASDRLQDLGDLWTAVGKVLEQLGNDIYNDFVTNLQNMQPSGLFGNTFAVIVDIFETIVEALVQFLGDLINAVLNLAADALAWLQTALTTPLNIPVLSWLYQALTGSPLTILDLCCLVFAFPATVVYVSLAGNPQDFTMPGAQSWPSIQNLPPIGATLRRGPRRAPRGGAPGDVTNEVLGALFALDYLVYAVLDPACDFVAAWQQTPPSGKGPLSDELVKILSFFNIVASVFGQGIDAPYDLFEGEESWTVAEGFEVAAWGANFAPLLANSVVLAAGGGIAEFWGKAGVLLTTFLGLGGIAVSLGAVVYVSEDDPSASNILGAVSDLVSYFPMFGKLLLTFAESTEDVSLVVLMVLDVVCDIATGALGCASMETS